MAGTGEPALTCLVPVFIYVYNKKKIMVITGYYGTRNSC
jgi:hypothetical protein